MFFEPESQVHLLYIHLQVILLYWGPFTSDFIVPGAFTYCFMVWGAFTSKFTVSGSGNLYK